MSGRVDDEVEPLPDDVRAYVDAFVAVERPSVAVAERDWAAIAGQVRPQHRRFVIAGGLALAIAAAVVITVAAVPRLVTREATGGAAPQAPFSGGAAETGGQAEATTVPEAQRRVTGRRPVIVPAAPEAIAPTPEPPPADASRGDALQRPRSDRRATPSSAEPESTLREEVSLFGAAKLALSEDGDPERALALLDEHARRFPRGALAIERQIVRADALCRAGRRSDALALRDRFLRQHADSTQAARMAAICP